MSENLPSVGFKMVYVVKTEKYLELYEKPFAEALIDDIKHSREGASK